MKYLKLFEEFINENITEKELNRILDKINKRGIDSLSYFEKDKLGSASRGEDGYYSSYNVWYYTRDSLGDMRYEPVSFKNGEIKFVKYKGRESDTVLLFDHEVPLNDYFNIFDAPKKYRHRVDNFRYTMNKTDFKEFKSELLSNKEKYEDELINKLGSEEKLNYLKENINGQILGITSFEFNEDGELVEQNEIFPVAVNFELFED